MGLALSGAVHNLSLEGYYVGADERGCLAGDDVFPPAVELVPGGLLGMPMAPSSCEGGTIFAMIDWSSCPAVERDPELVSGAWVFRGTRVPVSALFENLEDGALVSQFVEWFPGVMLEQVRAVLEHAARSALAPA